MFNEELIQKIRAEIERRKKAIHSTLFNDEYNDLLSFLDTLQEQEVKPDELEKAAIKYCPDDAYPFASDIINKEVRKAFIAGWKAKEESEKPMNQDGLEEEMERFMSNLTEKKGVFPPLTRLGFKAVARHFAKWGAEHRGSSEIQNELEEAAMNYIAPIENEDGLKVINFSGQDIKDAFIAGAEWKDRSINWIRDLVKAAIKKPEEAQGILARIDRMLNKEDEK